MSTWSRTREELQLLKVIPALLKPPIHIFFQNLQAFVIVYLTEQSE